MLQMIQCYIKTHCKLSSHTPRVSDRRQTSQTDAKHNGRVPGYEKHITTI